MRRTTDVSDGSEAAIPALPHHFRFTLESGHWNSTTKCPLCAKRGRSFTVRPVELIVQPDARRLIRPMSALRPEATLLSKNRQLCRRPTAAI